MPGKPKGLPKTGGRKKGTVNKKTSEILKSIEYVLGLLQENIEKDIKQLSPNERTRMWDNLQEYIRPKLSRVENQHEMVGLTKDVTITFIEPSGKADTPSGADISPEQA